MHPAGAGRGHPEDGVAAISGANRLPQLDLIITKILRSHNAAVGFHPFFRGCGKGAAVKPAKPVPGNGAIGAGQIRLFQQLAGRPRLEGGVQENRGRRFKSG